MKVIDCIQGEQEWWEARLGIPTASDFDKIITPPDYRDKWDCGNGACSHISKNAAEKCKKGKGKADRYRDVNMVQSASMWTYMNKLLGEWLRGKPDEGLQSEWMKRGKEYEEEARSYYAFKTDCDPTLVGFCIEDMGRYGCSPDALIEEDGGLEIKCPSPGVHVGYLLSGRLPNIHSLQTIGSLLVTGREWWDFISYHPDMEPLIIRTYRKDEREALSKLEAALCGFHAKLEKCKQELKSCKK